MGHSLCSVSGELKKQKRIMYYSLGDSCPITAISGTSERSTVPPGRVGFSLVSRHFVPGYFHLVPPGQDTLFRCRIFHGLNAWLQLAEPQIFRDFKTIEAPEGKRGLQYLDGRVCSPRRTHTYETISVEKVGMMVYLLFSSWNSTTALVAFKRL